MPHNCEVYFALSGDRYDPNDLEIGIQPTRIKRKATPIPKQSSWIYSAGKFESDLIDIYEISSNLIERLNPHVDAIIRAKQKYGLTSALHVVLFISPNDEISMPAIGFDEPVISFLARVDALIDIDTYRGES